MKARRERVHRDHRVDDGWECIFELCAAVESLQMRLECRRALGEVPVDERDEDRVLVREVLIQRPDRYASSLSDAVGGSGGVAMTLKNLSSGLQDRLDGRL